MVVMHAIKIVFAPFAIIFSMRYNSPAVMLASVLFFCWVKEWNMQSKAINWIASSVLSVYIVHMGPFGSYCFFKPLKWITASGSPIMVCIGTILFMLAFYAVCILIDKLRMIICSPASKCLTAKTQKIFARIETKFFVHLEDKQ